MKSWLKFLLCFLVLIAAISLYKSERNAENEKESKLTLKAVYIISRHGTDAFGTADLTADGVAMTKNIGVLIKEKYNDLIPQNPQEVPIGSARHKRCVDTLKNIASSIWPDNKDSWPSEDYYLPHAEEMLNHCSDCPVANEDYRRVLASQELKRVNEEHKVTLGQLQQETGLLPNAFSVYNYYDELLTNKSADVAMPAWVTEDVFDELGVIFSKFLMTLSSSYVTQRLRRGLFMKEIDSYVSHLRHDPEEATKFALFVSRGTVITYLLSTLGTPLSSLGHLFLPFGAALFFEVYDDDSELYVGVQFLDQTTRWPYSTVTLNLPCSQACHGEVAPLCPLEAFSELLAPYIPEEWQSECRFSCGLNRENVNSIVKCFANVTTNIKYGHCT